MLITDRVLAAVVLAAAVPASAGVINVPADQPTIQDAINVAVSGADEVVVAAGVYVENIDFLGKAITVRSTDPLDPAVVAATVIDGGGSGRVVTIDSGEGAGSVLNGLTVTNGSASTGAGVYVLDSVPTIANCVIESNVATGSGGGLFSVWFNFVTWTISDCTFRNNKAQTGGGVYADTFDFATMLTFDGCTFSGNRSTNVGGGMRVQGEFFQFTVAGCSFVGNTAVCSAGGGFFNTSLTVPQVSNTLFCRNWPDDHNFIADLGGNVHDDGCPNTARTVGVEVASIQEGIDLSANGDEVVVPPGTYTETLNFSGRGVTVRSSGGAAVTTIDAQAAGRVVTAAACEGPLAVLEGLTLTGGSVTGDGAGVYASASSPTIVDCVITDNAATGSGGGVRATGAAAPTITGTAISSNTAAAGGGLSAAAGTDVTVADSAFCANAPDDIEGIVTLNGLVFFSDEPGCDPVVTLGSCCLAGSCVVTRQSDCASAGGTYLGNDTTCEPRSCPAACPSDSDGDGEVGVLDLLALLGGWGLCP